MALAHGKVNWEDERIVGEAFGARKGAGEFNKGQLPVLLHKGKQYNESTAILRFVGRHTGAYPVDNIETCWYADSLVDYSNNLITKFYTIIALKKDYGEAGQKEFAETATMLVSHLNKQLEQHKKDFLAGTDKMTTADFQAAAVVFSYILNPKTLAGEVFINKGQEIVDAHKPFAAWVDRIKVELKEHFATPPVAPM
jgi:glutathione S-transferase